MTTKLKQAARPNQQAVAAMQLALDALETLDCGDSYKTHSAASALRKALVEQEDEIDWIETNKALAKEIIELKKQAEQEPVAWVTAKESFCGFPKLVFSETQKNGYKPLYADPVSITKQSETDSSSSSMRTTVRTKDPCNPLQDLTDDEIYTLYSEPCSDREMVEFARAVIAADRELNK